MIRFTQFFRIIISLLLFTSSLIIYSCTTSSLITKKPTKIPEISISESGDCLQNKGLSVGWGFKSGQVSFNIRYEDKNSYIDDFFIWPQVKSSSFGLPGQIILPFTNHNGQVLNAIAQITGRLADADNKGVDVMGIVFFPLLKDPNTTRPMLFTKELENHPEKFICKTFKIKMPIETKEFQCNYTTEFKITGVKPISSSN